MHSGSPAQRLVKADFLRGISVGSLEVPELRTTRCKYSDVDSGFPSASCSAYPAQASPAATLHLGGPWGPQVTHRKSDMPLAPSLEQIILSQLSLGSHTPPVTDSSMFLAVNQAPKHGPPHLQATLSSSANCPVKEVICLLLPLLCLSHLK